MSIKEMYRDDLLNRYASHTFDETVVNSFTLVEFKDGSSNVVSSAQCMAVDDAYQQIREDLVGGSEIGFCLTHAQRDALTSVANGTAIFHDDGFVEVYDGVRWVEKSMSRGGFYVSSAVATASITPASPVNIAVNSTIVSMGNATHFTIDTSNRRLTYTGTQTKLFRIEATLSYFVGTGNRVATFIIYKNGLAVAETEQNRAIAASGAGSVGNASVPYIMLLAENDYLELFVDVDAATTVTPQNLVFFALEL